MSFSYNKINVFVDKLGTRYEFAFMSYGIDIRIKTKEYRVGGGAAIWDHIIKDNKLVPRDNIWLSYEFENYINRLIQLKSFL